MPRFIGHTIPRPSNVNYLLRNKLVKAKRAEEQKHGMGNCVKFNVEHRLQRIYARGYPTQFLQGVRPIAGLFISTSLRRSVS